MDWDVSQNRDGGWPYGRGCSWTEPTCFAMLAQLAQGPNAGSILRGSRFLNAMQRPDGGFSPHAAVAESTWVTSLALLLPAGTFEEQRVRRAKQWLLENTGRESGWQWKLRQRLAGNNDAFPDGWPWFPGAAAWVIPTSFGLLALQRSLREHDDPQLRQRVEAARAFLLAHMCADGGWNHGGNRALGRDGESYPESTGIALLALQGVVHSRELDKAVDAARRHLSISRNVEGTAWLRMGLAAHGQFPGPIPPVVCRTTLDRALITLAQLERNPLCT